MLFAQIQKDIITAMKDKDEHTLSTLRMAKAALQNKEKDKQEPLTDAEVEAVLSTLIKQRKDAAEQFSKGGAEDRAEKELVEITMLEKYLPREATEAELQAVVDEFIRDGGAKNIGAIITAAKAKLAALNLRADGKMLSTIAKNNL